MLEILTSLVINNYTGYTQFCTTKSYAGTPDYGSVECLTVKDPYRTRYEKYDQAMFMVETDSTGLIEVFIDNSASFTVSKYSAFNYVFDPCWGQGERC